MKRTHRPRSLGELLPYWQCLPIKIEDAEPVEWGALLLKDGRVALGIEVMEADLFSASDAELNAQTRAWAKALRQLPAGMFVQTIFERYDTASSVLGAFDGQETPQAPPLLRQGRKAWSNQLHRDSELRQGRIVHWVGRATRLFEGKTGPSSAHQQHFAEAATHLAQNARHLLTTLEQHGISARVLGHADVLARCHQAINPTVPEALMPSFCKTSEQAVTDLSDTLPLSNVEVGEDSIRVGEPACYSRALGVLRLPATTDPTFWHSLMWELGPASFRLVVTHETSDSVTQVQRLKQRRKWLHALGGHAFAEHGANRAFADTEEVLERLSVDHEALVRTSITLLLTAGSLEALQSATHETLGALHARGIAAATLQYGQLPAWLSTLPAYGYRAGHKHEMLADAAAHLTPMSKPSDGDADADVVFKNRQRTLTAVSIRLTKRQDASAIIVGKTGSGKTFLFASLLKYGCLALGGHAIVADIKGPKNSSYRPLCDLLGGSYIHLRGNEEVAFNPFVPRAQVFGPDNHLDPERLAITRATLAMMGSGTDQSADDYVHSVLGDILRLVYTDPNAPNRPIILDDALKAFDRYVPRNGTLQVTAQRLRERLEFWCEDPIRRRLFNTPKNTPTQASLTVFDFEGFERDKPLAAVLMATLAGAIESKMVDLPYTTPKLFGFDEAWALFDGSPQATALLNRLYRTSRSYGACCYILTQSHQDIARSAAAQGVLSNLGLIFLMRHQVDHAAASALFRLHPRQQALFEGLQMQPNAFAETLMVDLNRARSQVLRYAPTPFDLWCDSSRPQDVEMRRQCRQQWGLGWPETLARLAERYPHGAPMNPTSSLHQSSLPSLLTQEV